MHHLGVMRWGRAVHQYKERGQQCVWPPGPMPRCSSALLRRTAAFLRKQPAVDNGRPVSDAIANADERRAPARNPPFAKSALSQSQALSEHGRSEEGIQYRGARFCGDPLERGRVPGWRAVGLAVDGDGRRHRRIPCSFSAARGSSDEPSQAALSAVHIAVRIHLAGDRSPYPLSMSSGRSFPTVYTQK